ncbi:hypothetical protein LAJ57_12750, partial [Streptococcus pneumoniae]|uniref:hypothetical protein n=1 Tax=Streptococcus pneumoniae TaxID=1313 RepID=UPI001CBD41ED
IYDQSGNARDLTSTTYPVVWDGAAVKTLGAKPAADFNGTTHYGTRADACGLTGATAYTRVIVADSDAYSNLLQPLMFGSAVTRLRAPDT